MRQEIIKLVDGQERHIGVVTFLSYNSDDSELWGFIVYPHNEIYKSVTKQLYGKGQTIEKALSIARNELKIDNPHVKEV